MKRVLTLMIVLSLALLLMNCDDDSNPSIWDKNEDGAPTPVISSVEPPALQYGGVGSKKLVIIKGTNFNAGLDKNFVYFGKMLGDVIEASTTELKVAAPTNYGDSLKIEVHVQGSYLPAVYGSEDNPANYELLAAEFRVGNYDAYKLPDAICCDSEGNLFVTVGKYVDKITPDGHLVENYIEMKARSANEIKVGPDGSLYYTYAKYILKTDSISGGHVYKNIKFNTMDLDFDSNKNLYIVGKNEIAVAAYSDLNTTTLKEFQDTTFNACRVLGNDLYLAGIYTGTDTTVSKGQFLCKVALNSDGTFNGSFQPVRNWDGTDYDLIDINNINFNENGKMYLATTNFSLLAVEGDYTSGVMTPVYPAILEQHSAFRMTWDKDEEIYINTNNSDENEITILRIILFEKGAPEYGRN